MNCPSYYNKEAVACRFLWLCMAGRFLWLWYLLLCSRSKHHYNEPPQQPQLACNGHADLEFSGGSIEGGVPSVLWT